MKKVNYGRRKKWSCYYLLKEILVEYSAQKYILCLNGKISSFYHQYFDNELDSLQALYLSCQTRVPRITTANLGQPPRWQ